MILIILAFLDKKLEILIFFLILLCFKNIFRLNIPLGRGFPTIPNLKL